MGRRQYEKCSKSVLGAKRMRLEESTYVTLKHAANDGQKLQQLKLQQQQQPQPQPVAHPATPHIEKEVVVHWSRSERQKYTSIRLMPPW